MKASLLSLALGLMAVLVISACQKDPITPPNNTPSPLYIFYTIAADTTVSFSTNATGATSYYWQFGDGSTSTDAAPTHQYTQVGSYTVTLQVTYTRSTTRTQTAIIAITGSNPNVTTYPYTNFKVTAASITQCSILDNWDQTTSPNSRADVYYVIKDPLGYEASRSAVEPNLSSADLPKVLNVSNGNYVYNINDNFRLSLRDDDGNAFQSMANLDFIPSARRPAPSGYNYGTDTTRVTLHDSTTTVVLTLTWWTH